MEKECTKCGEVKPLSAFYFRKERNMYNSFCKECFKINSNRWYAENSEHRNKKAREWEKVNVERVCIARRKASKSDHRKAYSSYTSATRRAKKKQAYVLLSKEEKKAIRDLYLLAKKTNMHVDHIKPLAKGGLHCLSNLQLLTPEENLKKGAKYEEPS